MPLDGKIGSGTIAWRYNMLTYSPPSSRTETFLTSSCVPRDMFALSIGRVTRAACQPCVCDWFWYRSRPSGCAGDVSHTLTELENVMERGLALGPAYMDRYVTLIFFKWRSFYFAFFFISSFFVHFVHFLPDPPIVWHLGSWRMRAYKQQPGAKESLARYFTESFTVPKRNKERTLALEKSTSSCVGTIHIIYRTLFFCGFSRSYRGQSREQKTCFISTTVMIPSYQIFKKTERSWRRTQSLANWRICQEMEL